METANDNMDDWETAEPRVMPKPTYFPFFFALSLMFLAWGAISLWIFCVTGIIGAIISLAGWINDMLSENRKEKETG